LHSWWNTLIVVAARIALQSKKKVIVAPRGMLSEYIFNSGKSGYKKIIHDVIGRKALAKCVLHATSTAEYDECRKLIPGWKGFVLPNIILLPKVTLPPHINENFTLIFLSRIHPKKGLEGLFEAISKLNFKVTLKIAGNGDANYIQELKNLAKTLNIVPQIEWVGWIDREEKFIALHNADLFVLVSLNENFANVVIEALHMGTAVLVSEDVGLSGFVKEKDTGWVSTLEVNDIIEKLTEAYHDKAKLAHIRSIGRAIIEETFCEEILIGRYVEEYKKK